MAILGSFFYTTYLFTSFILLAPVASLPPFLISKDSRWKIVGFWCNSNIYLCKKLCGLRYEILGAKNIPKKKGVVFIKHSSVYELFIGLLLFSPSSWVAKNELMYLPLFRGALKAFKFIPVKRGKGRVEVEKVISEGKKRLQSDNWIVIFPEGTRVKHGETKRYGLSGAILAVGTGSDVTPIAHNAGRYWGRRSFSKKEGVVYFSIGKQINAVGKTHKEVNALAKDWIDKETQRIDSL